jgi:AcrR family transcriptional regulator
MIETWSTRPNRPRLSRRDELLSVAADLFAERGFAKVTVDDIGSAVGLSGPALYHHFDGKESLLGEMLVRISESLLTKATTIVDRVSLHEALDPIIAMHVDFAVDNRSLITVHFRDLVQARKADQRRVKDLQGAYVDIWVDIVAAQHITVLDTREVRAAVHAVLGLINSTPFSGRLRRDAHVALLRTMASGSIAGFLGAGSDKRLATADPYRVANDQTQ